MVKEAQQQVLKRKAEGDGKGSSKAPRTEQHCWLCKSPNHVMAQCNHSTLGWENPRTKEIYNQCTSEFGNYWGPGQWQDFIDRVRKVYGRFQKDRRSG